jgi:hypothetical protein
MHSSASFTPSCIQGAEGNRERRTCDFPVEMCGPGPSQVGLFNGCFDEILPGLDIES